MPISLLSKGAAKNELSYSQDQTQETPHPQLPQIDKHQDSVEINAPPPQKSKPIFHLHGLDLGAIDRGVIKISAPLVGGAFGIPGPFADAIIEVRDNAIASTAYTHTGRHDFFECRLQLARHLCELLLDDVIVEAKGFQLSRYCAPRCRY